MQQKKYQVCSLLLSIHIKWQTKKTEIKNLLPGHHSKIKSEKNTFYYLQKSFCCFQNTVVYCLLYVLLCILRNKNQEVIHASNNDALVPQVTTFVANYDTQGLIYEKKCISKIHLYCIKQNNTVYNICISGHIFISHSVMFIRSKNHFISEFIQQEFFQLDSRQYTYYLISLRQNAFEFLNVTMYLYNLHHVITHNNLSVSYLLENAFIYHKIRR